MSMLRRCVGLGFAAVFASAALPLPLGTPAPAITQQQAIARAFEYTGLGVQPQVTASAELTTVPADDNVPFLRIAGKPAWRVTLDKVRLVARDEKGNVIENPTIHRLDVWLNAADGRLLKVISPFPEGMDPSTRPTLAQREDWMTRSAERYYGVPTEMPTLNFMQALESAGPHGAAMAKQLEGLYVFYKEGVGEGETVCPASGKPSPCPLWEITMRYLPPFEGFGTSGAPSQAGRRPFSHWRIHIDPSTGKWLGMGTVP
jgi:hypothetical protein